MKKLSNTEAELEKSVAYKKKRVNKEVSSAKILTSEFSPCGRSFI